MSKITMITSGNVNEQLAVKISDLFLTFNNFQKYKFDIEFFNKHKLINTCQNIYDFTNINKSELNVCVNYFIYIVKKSIFNLIYILKT